MIIELHMLQNFAPSCLNRDDTNSPKECQFGGYRRARISSQCIKRAIRWDPVFRESLKDHLATRSVRFPTMVCEELISLGTEESQAKEAGKQLEAIAKKEASQTQGESEEANAKDKTTTRKRQDSDQLDIFKTPQMVFYTDHEVEDCAKQIKSLIDRGMSIAEIFKKDKKGKFANLPVFPLPRSADIGLFGRMVTSAHFVNVDAACQVAHAISTHKVGVEFDFYTAVDDRQPKEETGAGMMGDIEFNSACQYRYSNIDLGQLEKNLGGDRELARKTVEAFIRASVAAIPSGKQTSFSAQNPPDLVFAVVRESGTWSLANAFAKPVPNESDLMGESITEMVKYWGRLNKAYPPRDGSIKAKPAFSLRDDIDLDGLDKKESLNDLVAAVNQAILG